MPFYIVGHLGDLEGPVTLPSGRPREFETRDQAERVAATLQARVQYTRYRVVELARAAAGAPTPRPEPRP